MNRRNHLPGILAITVLSVLVTASAYWLWIAILRPYFFPDPFVYFNF